MRDESDDQRYTGCDSIFHLYIDRIAVRYLAYHILEDELSVVLAISLSPEIFGKMTLHPVVSHTNNYLQLTITQVWRRYNS